MDDDNNINAKDIGLIYSPVPKEQWIYLYERFGNKEWAAGIFKFYTVRKKNTFSDFWFVHDIFMDFVEKFGVDKIIKENIKFSWFEDYSTPPDDRKS